MTPQVRIGDTERERAQAALSDHYAAGRLDHDEYSERLDRIWEARTQADLAPVFADLPRPAAPRPAAPIAGRRRGPRLPAPLLVMLVVLGAIAVATNLPLILVGLGVWFFFLRGGRCSTQRRMHSGSSWRHS